MKEWYLINNNTKPNSLGGFENQSFNDYKNDSFSEALSTDIADDLILYNYDLSSSTTIRGIMQGNTADTQLKSMERSVLVNIGTLHSGDYVYFEDEFWIVDGRPGNNKIYEKATLKECQYKIRWQKDNGDIVERYANLASASKYDIGEGGNKILFLKTNNYSIIIPNDKDSQTIEGKRVFIDLNDNPEKVFKITRNDDVLFNHYSHGGTLNLIADKTEFNEKTDNKELLLCDYIEPKKEKHSNNDKILKLSYKGDNDIKIGLSNKEIIGIIQNKKEEILPDIGKFEIITTDEIMPYVHYEINDNSLFINIDNEDIAIGGVIRVTFSADDGIYSVFEDFNIVNIF